MWHLLTSWWPAWKPSRSFTHICKHALVVRETGIFRRRPLYRLPNYLARWSHANNNPTGYGASSPHYWVTSNWNFTTKAKRVPPDAKPHISRCIDGKLFCWFFYIPCIFLVWKNEYRLPVLKLFTQQLICRLLFKHFETNREENNYSFVGHKIN